MKDINLLKTEGSICLKKVKSKAGVLKSDDCDGYLIESSEKEARRIIESLKGSGKRIGIIGGDDAFNRRSIETLKINYLVSPEGGKKVDSLKQRDSGINHVVANLAKEKGVSIVIDFSEVVRLKGKEKALRLRRLIQNVKICRKVGCEIKIASFAVDKEGIVDDKARSVFGESLGMSSNQAQDSTLF
jgi:RNase P/RNase MRP subunit p30